MPIQTLVPPAPAPQQQIMKAPQQAANQQGETNSFSREMAQATQESRQLPEEAKAAQEPTVTKEPDRESDQETAGDSVYVLSVLASAAAAVQTEVVDTPEDAQAVDAVEGLIWDAAAEAPNTGAAIFAEPYQSPEAAMEFAQVLHSEVETEAETETKNVIILEGSVPADGTDAREVLPEAGAAVMDDPEITEPNATARMPDENPKQTESAPVQTSFLENADELSVRIDSAPEEALPSRRVEIRHAQSEEAAPQEARDAAIQQPVALIEEDASAQAKRQDTSAKDAQPQVIPAAQTPFDPPAAMGDAPVENAPPAQPFEQIALEATLNQGVGRNHFVMRLQPETLGEVTVRLVVASDGVVARISVANDNARAAIAEQLYQLGDSMRAKGIDVRSIELVQDYTGQSAMLHDGNRGSADQNPTPRWKQTRFNNQAEVVAAVEGYDQALIAQITVGDTQTVIFDA